jgi:hypothetical protein
MGYDAYSKAIIGVKVKRTVEEETVTKYNPDDGTPYEKKIETKMLAIGDTLVGESERWDQEFGKLEFQSTDCESHGQMYFGMVVAKKLTREEMNKLWDEAIELLADFGVKADEVDFHKFLYESY